MFSDVGDPKDYYNVTVRTKAHKLPHGYPQCVSYKRETVYDILKEGYVCHVGFNYTEKNTQNSDTHPVVLPTLYGIDTTNHDLLYLHGSADARLYQTACDVTPQGVLVCLTVSLVDHMVVGYPAHSNAVYYRSVMAYGNAIPVTDVNEKGQALESIVEHMFKGRWNNTQHPDHKKDFENIGVLSLSLEEVSAKVQDGTRLIQFNEKKIGKGSLEYEEEPTHTYWTGVIPVCQGYAHPEPDTETIKAGLEIPDYLNGYGRPQTWKLT